MRKKPSSYLENSAYHGKFFCAKVRGVPYVPQKRNPRECSNSGGQWRVDKVCSDNIPVILIITMERLIGTDKNISAGRESI